LKINNIKTIFFDYDGTLHNSMAIYAPAFRKAYENLVENGYAEPKLWSDDEISSWIGYNPREMWEKFIPNLNEDIRNASSELIGKEMNRLIKLGYPVLYEDSIEILEYLKKKGYILVFISNCRKKYMENHKELFDLEKYFINMVCSEEYDFMPKQDILKSIIINYPKEMAIVGDRKKDMDAGKASGIFTIGCKYGFGTEEELSDADIKIGSIAELKNIF